MVRLRQGDRNRAALFVDRSGARLRELEDNPNAGAEVRLGGRTDGATAEVYRFFYRVRDGNLWILGMCSTGE